VVDEGTAAKLEALQQENAQLQTTLDGVVKERDFYFRKLVSLVLACHGRPGGGWEAADEFGPSAPSYGLRFVLLLWLLPCPRWVLPYCILRTRKSWRCSRYASLSGPQAD
jgi:hypothetical protein